jgi:CBS domain-containing protein
MKAREIMTPNPVSVEPEASVMQAVRLMLQRRISGLPVVATSGTLVGIVTEGDLLRRPELATQQRRPRWLEFMIGSGKLAAEYTHACGRKVYEVMSSKVYTAGEDTTGEELVQAMEKRHIKRIPIVRDGKLVGIVSRANLIRALASNLRSRAPVRLDDASVRAHLLEELERQSWAPTSLINVIVLKGVIQLWGVITDERQRQAIRAAAENTPGAIAVDDHLMLVQSTGFETRMS